MSKKPKFKVGDKVTSIGHKGIWDLVWYKEGDTTCAIKNSHMRAIAKISQLTLIKGDFDKINN